MARHKFSPDGPTQTTMQCEIADVHPVPPPRGYLLAFGPMRDDRGSDIMPPPDTAHVPLSDMVV